MAVVAASALVVGYWRSILFLELVAIFSFYAALSGYRVLFRERPDLGQRAGLLDWIAASITLAASASLLALGIPNPPPPSPHLSPLAPPSHLLRLTLP